MKTALRQAPMIVGADPGDVTRRVLADMALVRPMLDKIADKWTIMILTVLCPTPLRFTEILRRLPGITNKALADALRRLELDGFVTRTVLPTRPVGVEYSLTPLGHSLRHPFEVLCAWALLHADAVADLDADAPDGSDRPPIGQIAN